MDFEVIHKGGKLLGVGKKAMESRRENVIKGKKKTWHDSELINLTLFRSVCGLIRGLIFASRAAQYCKKWKRSQHKDICQLEGVQQGSITDSVLPQPSISREIMQASAFPTLIAGSLWVSLQTDTLSKVIIHLLSQKKVIFPFNLILTFSLFSPVKWLTGNKTKQKHFIWWPESVADWWTDAGDGNDLQELQSLVSYHSLWIQT